MNTFNAYTIDTAPADSKPLLEGTKAAFGFVPNLQSFMAESPELLAGYSALWDLFSKSTLTGIKPTGWCIVSAHTGTKPHPC
ncbi:hypothetical protein [Paraburkholderia tropica]|uniref:hypothetical protein n=1 Tax=Paraburkholderia tropica TaxID=92647 RepID=UPI0007EDD1D7|nr:hypothetical protein [Paraburkholderia tropica]OBR46709.1 hypothetical protein A6456_38185 [Paraburkholderia tropica]